MINKEKGLTLGVHFALGKRQLALINKSTTLMSLKQRK